MRANRNADTVHGRARSTAALRRRRRLMLGSLPLLLVVLLVAIKLLSLPVLASQGAQSFAKNDGDGVGRAAQGMGVLNIVEGWKAPFALGDAYVLRGDFGAARTQFLKALEGVSAKESCKVRVNLVLSVEKLGDAKSEAKDTAGADAFYKEGTDIIQAAPPGCFAPESESNQDGEGDQLKAAKERLETKQKPEDSSKTNTPDEGAKVPEEAKTPAQSKLDQLEERVKNAQQERSKSGSLKGNFSDAPPKPYAKPW